MSDRHLPSVRALCLPDIDIPIGGVKQLYRHVECLVTLGFDAAIVTENPGFRPSWFDSTAPSLHLGQCVAQDDFRPDTCILIVPETYVAVEWKDFWGVDLSRCARVIFNQNAYYSYESIGTDGFSRLGSLYDDSLTLQILSVSEDNHQFLERNLSIPDGRLSRIVHSVEPIFQSGHPKSNLMHWMSRKNPDHVEAVLLGIRRAGIPWNEGWRARPLPDLAHSKVAERLNAARIFLAFGHPEGFGLPILEAMAAGCWVVGYSGGGGSELFRYGASCEVAFGDWAGFLDGIQHAFECFALRPRETEFRLRRQALTVSTLYSQQQEMESIKLAWDRVCSVFSACKV
jgi:hypothetical protein